MKAGGTALRVSGRRRALALLGLALAGAAWLSWRLVADHDFAELMQRPGTGEMSFGAGVDLVVAMPLSWLPLIADYSRFGRTAGGMFRGSAGGYLLANIWFMALGAAYALVAQGDLLLTALAATGGGVALLLIVIDETDNTFADIHSAAVSTATLVPVPPRRLALVFGAVCTAIALFAPLGQYEGFLLLIGSVFAPLFGVLLAEHFLVKRGAAGAFNWRGILAWLLGICAYQALSRLAPDLGATLPAFLVAAAAYVALGRLRRLSPEV